MSRLGRCLAAVALALASSVAQADNFVIAGASPGGLWSLLGAGIDRAVRAADAGSSATYQTSAGGFANAALVARGDVGFGIAHNAELKLAAEGKPPFERPFPTLRAIAVLYDFSLFHPVMTQAFAEGHGVVSLSDIRTREAPLRLVVNRPGNIARDVAIRLFEVGGVPVDRIEAWGGVVHTAGSRDAANLVKGRQADMITNILFPGHSAILEIAAAMPVRLLEIDEATLQQVASEFGIAIKAIPAGAYDWLDRDMKTLALSGVLFTEAAMDEDRAYRLTSALIRHLDRIQGVHPAMAQLDLPMMASLRTIPYHSGAARAYAEAGHPVPAE